MKKVISGRKILLLIILLSPLALYLESCKKADPTTPLGNTLPILTVTSVGTKIVGLGVGSVLQGSSVAISADGNTLVFSGDNDNAGAIWIFNRINNAWNQVAKLIVPGSLGSKSVAISADGKTVIVGVPGNNNYKGAAWIFALNNGIWAQQGTKLVGTGAVGEAYQGYSVSISGDGNTVVIGGAYDDGFDTGFNIFGVGAAWIFTRNNGIWSQQGSKLVGTGAVGNPSQGSSVSISGDGNTMIIGGPYDNGNMAGKFEGAAWVFTRINGIWSQQGNKMIGTEAAGKAGQGSSVSISGDGNSFVIGGLADNGDMGAAWIFTRNNGIWAQQGSKLVGTGAAGNARQGSSVSLSGDGNKLAVGGYNDYGGNGATWIFTRNNAMWIQQGIKIVGSDNIGSSRQGTSVSINSDGITLAVGGPHDNGNNGAVWIFNR